MIDCLQLASLSSVIQCLWASPGAYPRVENPKGVSLSWAPGLHVDAILPWKGLTGTNTLAYLKKLKLTAVKRFITLGPDWHYGNTYKDFTYKDFTYKDFTYKDFTYKDFTYKDFTYRDFTYKNFTYYDFTYYDFT